MKTKRQLVSTTLYGLGQTVLDLQMRLRLLSLEDQELMAERAAIRDEQDRLNLLLAGLQNKVNWELRTNHRLLGLTPIDAEDEDGEDWKTPDRAPTPPQS